MNTPCTHTHAHGTVTGNFQIHSRDSVSLSQSDGEGSYDQAQPHDTLGMGRGSEQQAYDEYLQWQQKINASYEPSETSSVYASQQHP